MNCAHIMDVFFPENVYVLRLCEILSSGAVPVLCIWKCKAVSSHDPSDSLYVYMDVRIPKKCPYSPVTIGCSIC